MDIITIVAAVVFVTTVAYMRITKTGYFGPQGRWPR